MPAQESGTKPARPLPYQPNANLTSVSGTAATLALSNSAPFAAARRTSPSTTTR